MKTNFKGRVVVTSSGNIMALVVARSLAEKGVEVVGADCVKPTFLSMSKFVNKNEVYSNYNLNEELFIESLLKIIKKHHPEDKSIPYVLMPVFKESAVIAKYKQKLEEYITVAVPSYDLLKKVFPKDVFSSTARSHNVNIPETYFFDQKEDINLKNYPLLIKPHDDSGGKGIKKVYNGNELFEAYDENIRQYGKPPLIQKIATGKDYCFTALYSNGEIKASMAYKNLHQFPEESGSGVMRHTVEDEPFIAEADKLFKSLRWTGIAQVDFVWDGSKTQIPYMIEVNPRFWAGLFQSVNSGVDYPWLNYLLFTGAELPPKPEVDTSVTTKIPGVWLMSLLSESLNLSSNLNEFKQAGKKALDEFKKNHRLSWALSKFFKAIKEEKNPVFDLNYFFINWKQARATETEIFSNEDPNAIMGITYALTYFLKYNKLPPEVGL